VDWEPAALDLISEREALILIRCLSDHLETLKDEQEIATVTTLLKRIERLHYLNGQKS
jgi:hypothetical protein